MDSVFKIIVIGDTFCGKTCLSNRFTENRFVQTQNTILVNILQKEVMIDGQPILLHICDTGGMERFGSSLLTQFYRHADAVVLVYDMTNVETFNNLPNWISKCKISCVEIGEIPSVLVGNKCDLRNEIAVSHQRASCFATELGISLIETSAYLDEEYNNVNSIFMTLACKLRSRKPQRFNHDDNDAIILGKTAETKVEGNCCNC